MNKVHLFIAAFLAMCSTAYAIDTVDTVAVDNTNYPQLTNIPTIYINTDSGSDPADTENYLTCTIRWVEGTDMIVYTITDTERGIRGRGNTTWSANKKPWRIKFNDKHKFLGKSFAEAKSWTLLANAFDKSLMRNAITYYLGQQCGLDFCPAARFVDLVMNGTYRGTYQVSDQIEVAKKRVQAVDENGDAIKSQNDLTWLLEYANSSEKVDEPKITMSVSNSTYGYFQVKNPDQTYNETSKTYTIDSNITDFINKTWAPKLMTTQTGSTYCNPYSGYRSVNDEESLIAWYVATEITANWDGFYSIYNYRYPGDGADIPATNMFWGPMWDYDLAYGNHTETYSSYYKLPDFYTKLLCENNFVKSQVGENSYRRFQPLVLHMWDDPWFALNVQRKLNKLIDGGLDSYLSGKIDEMKTEISASAAKNFDKWPLTTVDKGYYYSSFGSTWDAQVTSLKNFISTRLSTLKTLVANKNTNNRYYLQKETNSVATESGVNVVLKRTANANKWTTVCLPVAVSSSVITDWFGEGAKVCQFTGVTTSGSKTTLNFTTVSSMTAGVPYFVKPTRDLKVDYTFLSTSTTGSPSTVTKSNYSFTGVYSPYTFDANTAKIYFDDGEIQLGNSAEQSINGMRAYISVPDGVDAKGVVLNIDGDEFAFATTVSRTVTPGTYESFCLPFDVKVSELRDKFDNIYCMTGSYVTSMPSFGETLPAKAVLTSEASATQTSKDISSYQDCQVPFALWQNTNDKKTFHIFMTGMGDSDINGNTNIIAAGTPFYGLVKEGVTSVALSEMAKIESNSEEVELNEYNYQASVSTTTTIKELGTLADGVTVSGTTYALSTAGAFAKTESVASNHGYIYTSEPIDNIVVHYDKGTWGNGGWDSVVAMIKSATVGDVNHDGDVNSTDAVLAINHYLDSSVEIDTIAADMNDDGEVNSTDAVLIINKYLNK